MFHLEQSISEWRKQMLAAGIKTPVLLEELEGHLRDDVEQQVRSGATVQQAFRAAVQRMGRAGALQAEFKKSEGTSMNIRCLVLVGIFGVLFGTGFILPALAWYRDHGTMPAGQLEPLLLGLVIAISGLSTALYGFKRRKA